MPKRQRHALHGNGPIVDRARQALRRVASEFGEVTATQHTSVSVRTSSGIALQLSYDPGNYVFSRVYNLRVSVTLPEGSPVPSGLKLSHKVEPHLTATAEPSRAALFEDLNAMLKPHLAAIDTVAVTTSGQGKNRQFTVVPMGGSYVWVLIPPVFKATAFPRGEVQRIINLIHAVLAYQAPAAVAES